MYTLFSENIKSSFEVESEKILEKISNMVRIELKSLSGLTYVPVKKYHFRSNAAHARGNSYINETPASHLLEKEEMQRVGQIETSILIPKEKVSKTGFNDEDFRATLSFAIYEKLYSTLLLGQNELNIQGFSNFKSASKITNMPLKTKADFESIIDKMIETSVSENAEPYECPNHGILFVPYKYNSILKQRSVDQHIATLEQDLINKHRIAFIKEPKLNSLILYQDRDFRTNLHLILDTEIRFWSVPKAEGLQITAFLSTTGLTVANEKEIVICTPRA